MSNSTTPPIVRIALLAVLGHWLGTSGGLLVQALGLAGWLVVEKLDEAAAWRTAPLLVAALLVVPGARPETIREQDGLYRFVGVVTSEPVTSGFGTMRARLRLDSGVAVTLRIAERASPPGEGDRIAGVGWLRHPRTPGHRPSLDCDGELLDVRPPAFPGPGPRRAILAWIESKFGDLLSPRVAPLVLRLLIGRGRELDESAVLGHRELGLAHLLAVSGLHTVFLAGVIELVLLGFVRRRGRGFVPLAVALCGYAWLAGFRPPVTRAVIGILLWRWTRERGHRFSVASALALAGLVTLLWFPEDFGSVGFRLSYSATAALAWLTPRRTATGSRSDWLSLCMWASACAQLATAAWAFEYFGYVSPWGVVLTPLALPIVLGLLASGLGLLACALLVPPLAGPLGHVVDAVGGGYLDVLEQLRGLPLTPLHALGQPPPGLAPHVLVLGFGLAAVAGSRRTFVWTCIAGIALFLLPWPARGPREFRMFAVGDGLCTLFSLGEQTVVFDCGDAARGRIAVARLVGALRDRGHTRVDHLILSHGDSDHVDGLERLCLAFPIGTAWLPESPKTARAQRILHRNGVTTRILPPGSFEQIVPGYDLAHPLPDADLAGSNDGGLVLRARFARGPTIVVMGDQEDAGIEAALAWLASGNAIDVLVLPHHGKPATLLATLVGRLAPDQCLASTSSLEVGGELPHGRRAWTTGACGDLAIVERDDGFVLSGSRGLGLGR